MCDEVGRSGKSLPDVLMPENATGPGDVSPAISKLSELLVWDL